MMTDQASRLRVLTGEARLRSVVGRESLNSGPRVIAVTSGKGGVGKTNLVVNLAIALGKMGKRVIVFDADLGLANVEVMAGIIPEFTLYEVLYGNKTLEDILVTGPHNMKLISGGSGMQELINLDNSQRERLVDSLYSLRDKADFILIDTGAGISRNVLGFVAAAGEVVVVITPEPTSLADAYVLIKVLSRYKVHYGVQIVVNRVANDREAVNTIGRMQLVASRFLSINVDPLGYVSEDEDVGKAIKRQVPLILYKPNAVAARDIFQIAKKLTDGRNENSGSGMERFISRLFKLFDR